MRSEVQVLLDPPFAFWHVLGALAQLGERLICIQEVIGSIPIGSTSVLHHMIIKPAPGGFDHPVRDEVCTAMCVPIDIV